jgi:transposase
MEMRFIGLDVHQKYVEGCEIGPDKKKRRFRIANTRESWEEFAQTLDPETRVVMEATSNAFWIYDILSGYPAQVVIANTLKTRAIAEARIKTDALDAQILAQLLAADFIPESWVPDKEKYQLRVLLHHRIRLAKIRTMLKNKIHAVLIRNGIQSPWSDLFGKNGRRFLESISLPETEQIIVCSSLRLLDAVQKEMTALEADLFVRAKENPDVKLLMGIPGISALSALTILAEIGDISRFSSPKKLASYAGLVPSVHQSGKTRYTGRITKEGRSVLRWILVQCAQRAVQSEGKLRAFYLGLKAKKGHKIAIVATARKLLHVVWAVLVRQEEYRDLRRDLLDKKLKTMNRKAKKYEVTTDELWRIIEDVGEIPDEQAPRWLQGAG